MNASGAWVVTWKDDENTGQIRARRYSPDDALIRGFAVSTAPLDSRFPHNPAAAISGGGNFVIAWEELLLGEGSQRDVLFREFDQAGLSLTDPTILNEAGRESGFPRPAMDAEGNIVVLWQDAVLDGEYGLKGKWFASSSPTDPGTVSLSEWLGGFFPDPDDPDADPEADPDGDTLVNRLEFAFAGHPTDPSIPARVPQAKMTGSQATVDFGRFPNAELIYIVQYSLGLDEWVDAIPEVDFQEVSILNPQTQIEEVQIILSPGLLIRSNGLFCRIKVMETP
jgi:hypothetical protein